MVNDLFEFRTVGAGVHDERPARRPGNALGKFQSAVAFPCRGTDQLHHCIGSANLDANRFPFLAPLDFAELSDQMNHRPAYAAIADQGIAAVAQERDDGAVSMQERQDTTQSLVRFDLNEVVCRTADFHRRIAR